MQIFLFAATLLQNPIAVAPADSMLAIAALDSAAVTLNRIAATPGQSHLEHRLWSQLQTWRTPDEAWRAVRMHDVAAAAARADAYGIRHTLMAPWVIAELFRSRQYALARRRLDELPASLADTVAESLGSMLGNVTAETFEELLRVTRTAHGRAQLRAGRANEHLAKGDTAGAIALLSNALQLTRSAGVHAPLRQRWALQIRAWGGDMPLDTLVALTLEDNLGAGPVAMVPPLDALQARIGVARALQYSEPDVAAALADTMLAQIIPDTSMRSRLQRAELLAIRAGPGDSASARALRDSATAGVRREARPGGPYDRAGADAGQALFHAARERDSVRFLEAIRDTALRPGSIRQTLETITAVAGQDKRLKGAVPSESTDGWLAFVYRTAAPAVSALEPTTADSVRVALIRLLAELDPVRALETAAAEVRTQPYRDRALAEAIRTLAATDADRAAAEAQRLDDVDARNTAFLELTQRAVAGGRLAAAVEFADQTPTGESRVRAQLAIATALAGSGVRERARERLRALLPRLDPIWACSGYCFAGPPVGMDRRLIGDVAVRALELDLRDELWQWAARQTSDPARAAAWLVLPEAIAHITRKQYMVYPMH